MRSLGGVGKHLVNCCFPLTALLDWLSTVPAMDSTRVDVPLNEPHERKIFIQRDYSDGLIVKFSNMFPQELVGVVDPQLFCETINEINRLFAEAEALSASTVTESIIACLSAFLIYACFDTHYNRCLKKIKSYIEQQNETIWRPKGLCIRDPMDRGLRVIEIILYETDPPSLDQTLTS